MITHDVNTVRDVDHLYSIDLVSIIIS
jgi:hypothetical protein